jgi:hypothetical protein
MRFVLGLIFLFFFIPALAQVETTVKAPGTNLPLKKDTVPKSVLPGAIKADTSKVKPDSIKTVPKGDIETTISTLPRTLSTQAWIGKLYAFTEMLK